MDQANATSEKDLVDSIKVKNHKDFSKDGGKFIIPLPKLKVI